MTIDEEYERDLLEDSLVFALHALKLYASYETWDKEKFLLGRGDLRLDLEETTYSRFTPGKRARRAIKEISAELTPYMRARMQEKYSILISEERHKKAWKEDIKRMDSRDQEYDDWFWKE